MSRNCNDCDAPMMDGYCIESGLAYYCTEACLLKNMTWDEFLNLYDDGDGDSYWTEWEYNNCVSCGVEAYEGHFIRNEFYCMKPDCQPATGARSYWKAYSEADTEHWDIIVPQLKWRDTFRASSDDTRAFDGQRFTVMKDITQPEMRDSEYGYVRLYDIRFDDGREIAALEEEVEDFTYAIQEYEVVFELDANVTVRTTVYHEDATELTDREIVDEALGYAEDAGISLGNAKPDISKLRKDLFHVEQLQAN